MEKNLAEMSLHYPVGDKLIMIDSLKEHTQNAVIKLHLSPPNIDLQCYKLWSNLSEER